MIWFTADTHFGHARVIEYSARPFVSADAMDAALIALWNDRIGPRDTVYHLGDFALCGKARMGEVRAALNGRIHLVAGNHDRLNRAQERMFESVAPMMEIKIDGMPVTLCHYPMLRWNRSHYGAYHLHGHTHGTLPSEPGVRRLDVGVDAHGYLPWSWDEVREEMVRLGGDSPTGGTGRGS